MTRADGGWLKTLTDLPINLGLAFAVTGAWFIAVFVVTNLLVRRRN